MSIAVAQAPLRKVLVVDDEDIFRELLAGFFRRKGYEVYTAPNGNAAFELLKTTRVDAVISDIRMPDGDGVQLLDQIRAADLGMPIVLLMSGFSELATEDAYHKGAEALFSKPFDSKVLEETIKRFLVPLPERWAKPSIDVPKTEITVELSFQNLTEAVHAKIVSLGRGGAFIALASEKLPNVTDNLGFKINFASAQAMMGSGVVRWIRVRNEPDMPSGFGLEFTYLSEPDRERISEFIKANVPTAFIPKK